MKISGKVITILSVRHHDP